MTAGWIKIYQTIQQHWIWEQPRFLKWWIDILMLAEWRDTSKRNVCNHLCVIKRGQLVASVRFLRDRWQYKDDNGKTVKPTERTILKFLQMLEADEMIKIDCEILPKRTTLITVCNYNEYQVINATPDNGLDNGDENGGDNAPDNGDDNKYEYKNKRNLEKKDKSEKSDFSKLEQEFEDFRKAYPGRKRGHDTEFQAFKRKHKNWTEIVPLLMPALQRLIEHNEKAQAAGQWTASYANLSTWLYQARWEEELPEVVSSTHTVSQPQTAAAPTNYDEEVDAFKSKN